MCIVLYKTTLPTGLELNKLLLSINEKHPIKYINVLDTCDIILNDNIPYSEECVDIYSDKTIFIYYNKITGMCSICKKPNQKLYFNSNNASIYDNLTELEYVDVSRISADDVEVMSDTYKNCNKLRFVIEDFEVYSYK